MARDIEAEVAQAAQWMKRPPKVPIRNKTERLILQSALTMFMYRVIYPGLTKSERTNLDSLNKLADIYDSKHPRKTKQS